MWVISRDEELVGCVKSHWPREYEGFDCSELEHLAELVRRNSAPPIILLDTDEMASGEFEQALLLRKRTKNLPWIVVTSDHSVEEGRRLLSLEPYYYAVKSPPYEDICEALGALFKLSMKKRP